MFLFYILFFLFYFIFLYSALEGLVSVQFTVFMPLSLKQREGENMQLLCTNMVEMARISKCNIKTFTFFFFFLLLHGGATGTGRELTLPPEVPIQHMSKYITSKKK